MYRCKLLMIIRWCMCRVMGHSYPLLLSWERPSSCVMYGCDCVWLCKIKNNTRVIYGSF